MTALAGFGVGDEVMVHDLTSDGHNRGSYKWTGEIVASDLSGDIATHLVIPENSATHNGLWVIELQLVMVRCNHNKNTTANVDDAWDRAMKGI